MKINNIHSTGDLNLAIEGKYRLGGPIRICHGRTASRTHVTFSQTMAGWQSSSVQELPRATVSIIRVLAITSTNYLHNTYYIYIYINMSKK